MDTQKWIILLVMLALIWVHGYVFGSLAKDAEWERDWAELEPSLENYYAEKCYKESAPLL